jgi:preprotein translocase subunit YajC
LGQRAVAPAFDCNTGVSMDFLISTAHAQAAAPAAGAPNPLVSFLPLIVLFGIFYFMLIRPQMKRAKEQKAMIDALGKGDEVVALGGLVGRIVELNDQYATLEIAPETKITVQRPAVQMLLPKGTIKSLK